MAGGRPKISDETWERVAELYAQGYPDMRIAREVGICSFSVYNWRLKNGKVKSNYTLAGYKHRAEFGNFERCFDYNAHIQQWFQEVGAETTDEKRLALRIAAKEILNTMQGRNL